MAKILVVDDMMSDFGPLYKVYLRNHELVFASNADEGKQKIQEAEHGDSPFDVVVTDREMPAHNDGIKMATELRNMGFNKPIIMVSAGEMTTAERLELIPDTITDFLDKEELQKLPLMIDDVIRKQPASSCAQGH